MTEFDSYKAEIERLIRARYWRVADVDDLVSEAWVGAWQALRQSDHPARRVVARRAALWAAVRYLREGRASVEKGTVQIVPLNEELDAKLIGSDPAPMVIDRLAARQAADRAMAALTEHQQQALRLRYWHDLDNAEVAECLGIKLETATCLLSQALGWCRRALAGETIRRRQNKGQAACMFGHPLTEENRWVTGRGQWRCRTCAKERHARWRARRKEKLNV